MTGAGFNDLTRARRAALVLALLFTCGFTLSRGALPGNRHRLRPYLARVSQVSGALLILVGLRMMFDYFTVMAAYPQPITPAVLQNRL